MKLTNGSHCKSPSLQLRLFHEDAQTYLAGYIWCDLVFRLQLYVSIIRDFMCIHILLPPPKCLSVTPRTSCIVMWLLQVSTKSKSNSDGTERATRWDSVPRNITSCGCFAFWSIEATVSGRAGISASSSSVDFFQHDCWNLVQRSSTLHTKNLCC